MRVCALILVLLLLALGAACDIGGDGPAPPLPSPSPVTTSSAGKRPAPTPSPAIPTPSATPGLPKIIDGVQVVALKIGTEVELPDDVALILETGCTGCDGPTTGFIRVYRDGSGEIRTETLLSIERLGLPPRLVTTEKGVQEERPYITGFAVNQDASEMVVSVCLREWCGSGGLVAWSPNSETALFRSTDGGITWEKFGELNGGGGVAGLVQEGTVLVFTWEKEMGPATFSLFPTGQQLEPPAGAGQPWPWPATLPNGNILWPTEDGRILRSDGSVFAEVHDDVQIYPYREMRVAPDDGRFATALYWRSREPGLSYTSQTYIGVFSEKGRLLQAFAPGHWAGVGVWLSPDLLVANVAVADQEQGVKPAQGLYREVVGLIDLTTGTVHVMPDPFLDPGFPNGRNIPQAVMHGPFARVVGTDSCLNIRAEPGTTAEVLECAADDVLLRDRGETRLIDETVWLRVLTPAGTEGWASTDYLER